MTNERYQELFKDEATFTEGEIAQGWHFCWEFDGLPVGPETGEWGDDKLECRCGHPASPPKLPTGSFKIQLATTTET